MLKEIVSASVWGLEELAGGPLDAVRTWWLFGAAALVGLAVGRVFAGLLGAGRGIVALAAAFACSLAVTLAAFGIVEGPVSSAVTLPMVAPYSGVVAACLVGLLAAYGIVPALMDMKRLPGLMVTAFALLAASAAFWGAGLTYDLLERAEDAVEERDQRNPLE